MEIRRSTPAERTLLLSLSGEMDVYTAPELEEAIRAEAGHYRLVIVDLDKLTFIDSSGLGALVGARSYAMEQGTEFRVVCSQPKILRTFQIAGIPDMSIVFPGVEAALAAGEPVEVPPPKERQPLTGEVELSVPPAPEFVAVVRLTASGICHRMGLSYEEIEDVKQALSEACTNAVQYFNCPPDKRQSLRIRFSFDSDRLAVEVRDPASTVDWEAIERAPRKGERGLGLGIWVMRQRMDEVQFQSSESDGSCVRLIKKL